MLPRGFCFKLNFKTLYMTMWSMNGMLEEKQEKNDNNNNSNNIYINTIYILLKNSGRC